MRSELETCRVRYVEPFVLLILVYTESIFYLITFLTYSLKLMYKKTAWMGF